MRATRHGRSGTAMRTLWTLLAFSTATRQYQGTEPMSRRWQVGAQWLLP